MIHKLTDKYYMGALETRVDIAETPQMDRGTYYTMIDSIDEIRQPVIMKIDNVYMNVSPSEEDIEQDLLIPSTFREKITLRENPSEKRVLIVNEKGKRIINMVGNTFSGFLM